MESLLEGIKCLELASFAGEWLEHELMDELMMTAVHYEGIMVEDDVLASLEQDGSEEKKDIESMESVESHCIMEYEEMDEQDEENYEVWCMVGE